MKSKPKQTSESCKNGGVTRSKSRVGSSVLKDWSPSESTQPIDFQAFAWNVDDGVLKEDDYDRMDFTVHVFGKNQKGESVAMHVKGYHPTFCVKYDADISTMSDYDRLFDLIGKQLCTWEMIGNRLTQTAEFSDHLIRIVDPIILRKDCWGFNFEENVPFFKFSFRSQFAYNKIISIFKACQKNTMSEEEMQDFTDEYLNMVDDNGYAMRADQGEFLKDKSLDTGVPAKALNFMVKLAKNHLPLKFAKGKLFEVIDPILRFAHMKKLKMAGWIRAKNYVEMTKSRLTTCTIEVCTTYDNLEPLKCDDINLHLKEMAFDIEAYSHNDLFPDAADPRNYCYQIGITLKDYSQKGYDRLLLHCRTPKELRGQHSGACLEIPDIPTCLRSHKPTEMCENKECVKTGLHDVYMVATRVENFDTEKDLLLRFANIIVDQDPDLIYAYNSDIFDWNYIMIRAEITMRNDLDAWNQFRRMSRMKNYLCETKEAKFASSAYGDNKYMRAEIPGRLNIDLMIWVQRNMPAERYPSYSLDTVAEMEIGEQKRDVDAKEIFQAFRSGDPEELTRIGDYCCQDTMLVQKLVNKLDVVTQMFEMSNITDTPPMYLLQKGQQIKCFSQISKEAMEKGFLIPLAEEREAGKFKGAIVLDPIIGKYDSPVAVLDFASLYPSIQMSYKVCYTTIVLDPMLYNHIMQLKKDGKPLVVKGVKFDVIEWDEDTFVFHDVTSVCEDCKGRLRNSVCSVCEGNKHKTSTFTDIEDAKKMGFTEKQIRTSMAKSKDEHSDCPAYWTAGIKHHEYAFAQVNSSIIPDLQDRLKKSRKVVKAMMAPIEHSKNPDDQLKYRVLNGRQLAIKVSMNSIYGFTSAFMMNLQALSASVTAKGRQMIEATK